MPVFLRHFVLNEFHRDKKGKREPRGICNHNDIFSISSLYPLQFSDMKGAKRDHPPKLKLLLLSLILMCFPSKLPLKFVPAFSNRFYLVMT